MSEQQNLMMFTVSPYTCLNQPHAGTNCCWKTVSKFFENLKVGINSNFTHLNSDFLTFKNQTEACTNGTDVT